ncbi:MAG: CPBP family intramembrane metalloprotease [Clostridia bacterium]|nr:CPBP family intramembrane metalloprotease [Clostridia bacterium]
MSVLPRMKVQDDAMLGGPGKPVFAELIIFLLVFFIISTAQGLVLMIGAVVLFALKPELLSRFVAIYAEIAGAAGSGETGNRGELIGSLNGIVSEILQSLMLQMLFSTVVIIAGALIYCRAIEKRPFRSMGLRKPGAVPEYLAGLFIGLVMMSLSVGICMINGSMTLSFKSVGDLTLVPFFFVAYLIQGMSEELLCRGYLMMSAQRRTGIIPCVIISSSVFSLLHVSNPGAGPLALINIFIFGVFEALLFLKRGSIWMAAAVHSMWNFAQGNLFGVAVSGAGNGVSVFSTALSEKSSDAHWNGGSFGSEGGLAVTIVLALAIAAVLFLPAKADEISEIRETGSDVTAGN